MRGPLTSVEKNYTLPSWIALDSDADSIVFPLSIRLGRYPRKKILSGGGSERRREEGPRESSFEIFTRFPLVTRVSQRIHPNGALSLSLSPPCLLSASFCQ